MRSVQQHLLPQSAAGPLSFPSVLVAPLVYSQDRSLLLPASDPARVAQRLKKRITESEIKGWFNATWRDLRNGG